MNSTTPIVLVFAGHDPSGGAGLQADIEVLLSLGCHPVTVATALTVQDTRGVSRFQAVPAELVLAQARAVLDDFAVGAIKTGMLASAENVHAVASVAARYPHLPLVVDPVLASGRGDALADEGFDVVLREQLLPHATLATPNSVEARRLAPTADTLDACAQELLATGCEYVLITGTHEPTEKVENRFYGGHRLIEHFAWPRLPGEYHGSGCTLAAACAANMAHGLAPAPAVAQAQRYTWQALRHARSLGHGQLLPDRLFWSRKNDDG